MYWHHRLVEFPAGLPSACCGRPRSCSVAHVGTHGCARSHAYRYAVSVRWFVLCGLLLGGLGLARAQTAQRGQGTTIQTGQYCCLKPQLTSPDAVHPHPQSRWIASEGVAFGIGSEQILWQSLAHGRSQIYRIEGNLAPNLPLVNEVYKHKVIEGEGRIQLDELGWCPVRGAVDGARFLSCHRLAVGGTERVETAAVERTEPAGSPW